MSPKYQELHWRTFVGYQSMVKNSWQGFPRHISNKLGWVLSVRNVPLNPWGNFLPSESLDFMQNWGPDRVTHDLMHLRFLLVLGGTLSEMKHLHAKEAIEDICTQSTSWKYCVRIFSSYSTSIDNEVSAFDGASNPPLYQTPLTERPSLCKWNLKHKSKSSQAVLMIFFCLELCACKSLFLQCWQLLIRADNSAHRIVGIAAWDS